jgi:formamidopyrimidine-DNA glycosylase
MPEGPEVRKYADSLNATLAGKPIKALEARTREARAWLKENESRLIGRRVLRITSHGKHLLGFLYGGYYFHSHLMMWGRWQVVKSVVLPLEKDRRERARVVVDDSAAILLSAPIFNVGKGDPYKQIDNLRTLGPDVLPAKGKFNKREFRRRMLLAEHRAIPIGAALLNQRILAGLGNYLRAEVLFHCGLNPWRKVEDLNEEELRCLDRTAPELALRSYVSDATATEEDRTRMRADESLVYQVGREYGTRHLVFRRTNLPCLRCGETIRQLRQPTYNSEDPKQQSVAKEVQEERTRIVYFCPKCQNVDSTVD